MDFQTSLENTKCFTKNEYFYKYIDIIKRNFETSKGKYTHKHHIIPRSYYKVIGYPINNDPSNLVYLNFYDHILAHYYLCLCVSNERLKFSLDFAFMSMTKEFVNDFDITRLEEYQNIYESFCERNSRFAKERQRGPCKEVTKQKIRDKAIGRYSGDVWIHCGDINKHVPKEELPLYLSKGFEIGRDDKEAFRKISESQKLNPGRSMLGKKQSDYQKKTVSEKLTGVKKSDQARLNMSKAKKNKKLVSNDMTKESFFIEKEQVSLFLQQHTDFHLGKIKIL